MRKWEEESEVSFQSSADVGQLNGLGHDAAPRWVCRHQLCFCDEGKLQELLPVAAAGRRSARRNGHCANSPRLPGGAALPKELHRHLSVPQHLLLLRTAAQGLPATSLITVRRLLSLKSSCSSLRRNSPTSSIETTSRWENRALRTRPSFAGSPTYPKNEKHTWCNLVSIDCLDVFSIWLMDSRWRQVQFESAFIKFVFKLIFTNTDVNLKSYGQTSCIMSATWTSMGKWDSRESVMGLSLNMNNKKLSLMRQKVPKIKKSKR